MTHGSGQVHEPGCTGSTALLVLAPEHTIGVYEVVAYTGLY
jgi:hypothetical protein